MCTSVLVMEHLQVEQQFFVQISLDTKKQMPVITYSTTGGMALDTLEALYPERVKRLYIDYTQGINILDIMQVATDLGVEEKTSTLVFLLKNLFECFTKRDCSMVQLNPLVLTPQKTFRAANVKVVIDDHALFRQQ